MRKNVYIFFLMTAVAALVAHMVIPHHEHGETICFENLACDSDDENTPKETHACCLDQQEIIRSENEDQTFSSCAGGAICDLHFPPIMLFIGNFFDLAPEPIDIDKPYLNLYTSADILSVNTLRGPPQI